MGINNLKMLIFGNLKVLVYSYIILRCNDIGEYYRDNNKYYVYIFRVVLIIWRKVFLILIFCYRVENRFFLVLYI